MTSLEIGIWNVIHLTLDMMVNALVLVLWWCIRNLWYRTRFSVKWHHLTEYGIRPGSAHYPMTNVNIGRKMGCWEVCNLSRPRDLILERHGINTWDHAHWEITYFRMRQQENLDLWLCSSWTPAYELCDFQICMCSCYIAKWLKGPL